MWIAAPCAAAEDPFADAVVSFTPGVHAGFGQDFLPGIVLGPPRGSGDLQGSFDVVSLGDGGSIVIGFDTPVICDGPGADFTIFENAFHSGTLQGPLFIEYGIVAVSQDGIHFVDLPFDAVSHAGLAGQTPVYSNADSNEIDPLDPAVSGGDHFDLATTGLAWAAYVRITDAGAAIDDPGNHIPPADNSGFDLDAIAALHGCDPATLPTSTVTPTATATPTGEVSTPTPTRSRLILTSTPTRTHTPGGDIPTATTTPLRPGDLNGDGNVDDADSGWLGREIYDGDGDAVIDVNGGTVHSGFDVDANNDGRVTIADIVALARIAGE